MLYACDFDPEAGRIAQRRVLQKFSEGHGRPDGGSVDEDGYYWSALYAGGRVVRLSPGGDIVQEVVIPAARPTMVAFGGLDRKTACVTTANEGLGAEDLADAPPSGGLFSFRVETPGLPEFDFAG